MSAYQVESDAIDLIVSALVEREWSGFSGGLHLYFDDGVVIYTDELKALAEEAGDGFSRITTRETTQEIADIIGRELVAANCASLAARYPSDTTADKLGGMICYLPSDYSYRRVSRDVFADFGHVFGALACFEYQACETGDRTLAEVICETVRKSIALRVFDRLEDETGINWHWTREQAAEQRRALRERITASMS